MRYAINLNSSAGRWEPGGADFNVLMAYEDLESGKRAKRTYDFLSSHLGHECRFASQMWKLEVLDIPQLLEAAIQDATMADLILISLRNGSALPASTGRWIDTWSSRPRNALALVALFHGMGENSPNTIEARNYLARAAQRGGLEFFAHPDDAAGGHTFGVNQAAPALVGTLAREMPASHWGINE